MKMYTIMHIVIFFLSFSFFYHLKENDVLDEVVLVFELGLLYIKIGFLMFLYLV